MSDTTHSTTEQREFHPQTQQPVQSHNRTPVDDSEMIIAAPQNGAKKTDEDTEFTVVSKRMSSGVYQLTGGERTVTLSLGRDLLWHWVDDSDSSRTGDPTRLKRSAKAQAVAYLTELHNSNQSNGAVATGGEDDE